MKKIVSLALVVIMLMVMATMGFAEAVYNRAPGATNSIYAKALTYVTTSTGIAAGQRILGFAYTDSAAGTGGIFDAASTSTNYRLDNTTYITLIGEISVAAGSAETLMFPLPYTVVTGVLVHMSTATGTIMVFYE